MSGKLKLEWREGNYNTCNAVLVDNLWVSTSWCEGGYKVTTPFGTLKERYQDRDEAQLAAEALVRKRLSQAVKNMGGKVNWGD